MLKVYDTFLAVASKFLLYRVIKQRYSKTCNSSTTSLMCVTVYNMVEEYMREGKKETEKE